LASTRTSKVSGASFMMKYSLLSIFPGSTNRVTPRNFSAVLDGELAAVNQHGGPVAWQFAVACLLFLPSGQPRAILRYNATRLCGGSHA
jgi:hypothetical protein